MALGTKVLWIIGIDSDKTVNLAKLRSKSNSSFSGLVEAPIVVFQKKIFKKLSKVKTHNQHRITFCDTQSISAFDF